MSLHRGERKRANSLLSLVVVVIGHDGSSLLHLGFLQLRAVGLLFVAVLGLLIVVASLVAEHEI